jgi:hypothetical protein
MNKVLALCLATLVCLPVSAQESGMQSLPGYVDFGALDSVYGEPRVRINISGTLLKFMAAVSKKEEPQAAALMQNLDGVRVNVYSTAGQAGAAIDRIASVKKILLADTWEPIVQVKESAEEVQIFVKTDAEQMQGLTVMTANEEEAVFINILGAMDPAHLQVVMDQLNTNVDIGSE